MVTKHIVRIYIFEHFINPTLLAKRCGQAMLHKPAGIGTDAQISGTTTGNLPEINFRPDIIAVTALRLGRHT